MAAGADATTRSNSASARLESLLADRVERRVAALDLGAEAGGLPIGAAPADDDRGGDTEDDRDGSCALGERHAPTVA